jgi:hypothetical protein
MGAGLEGGVASAGDTATEVSSNASAAPARISLFECMFRTPGEKGTRLASTPEPHSALFMLSFYIEVHLSKVNALRSD